MREAVAAGKVRPVRVNVHSTFREQLRLTKKRKSGRLFVPLEVASSLEALRRHIEDQLELPAQLPYVLEYNVTKAAVKEDGPGRFFDTFPLDSDAALSRAFAGGQGAPPPLLLVTPDPTVEWPPVPTYLRDLELPSDGPDQPAPVPHALVSFYSFSPVADPDALCGRLAASWAPLRVVGRVYVSPEGINAQVAVPAHVLDNFQVACRAHEELATTTLNVDRQVDAEEFARFPPFSALDVRPRPQIIADGLDGPLDLRTEAAGQAMEPAEWHEALSDPSAVVLDCRNTYESDVGRFANAVALNTSTFRDTWSRLAVALEGKPANTPVLTYCTGGIRCVKVGAYLEQVMGFTNVARLEGGIVNYTRHVREVAEQQGVDPAGLSKFRGVNYVFNDRLAESVTNDIPNPESAEPRAQEALAALAERNVAVAAGASARPSLTHASHGSSEEALEDYADKQSGAESRLLQELRHATMAAMPNAAHMVSGHLQGRLLAMLAQLVRPRRVLEVGTFTGYATLCLAEAVPTDGCVVTLEVDPSSAGIAQRFFDRSEFGDRIELRQGRAMDLLSRMAADGEPPFDIAFIDADKRRYGDYLDFVLDHGLVKPGSLVVVDNVLWKGRVLGVNVAGPAAANPENEDKAERRDRILTQAMHEFNVKVRKDTRLEQVVLPLRDGLSLIRVK